jgi:hypothetical protein
MYMYEYVALLIAYMRSFTASFSDYLLLAAELVASCAVYVHVLYYQLIYVALLLALLTTCC